MLYTTSLLRGFFPCFLLLLLWTLCTFFSINRSVWNYCNREVKECSPVHHPCGKQRRLKRKPLWKELVHHSQQWPPGFWNTEAPGIQHYDLHSLKRSTAELKMLKWQLLIFVTSRCCSLVPGQEVLPTLGDWIVAFHGKTLQLVTTIIPFVRTKHIYSCILWLRKRLFGLK